MMLSTLVILTLSLVRGKATVGGSPKGWPKTTVLVLLSHLLEVSAMVATFVIIIRFCHLGLELSALITALFHILLGCLINRCFFLIQLGLFWKSPFSCFIGLSRAIISILIASFVNICKYLWIVILIFLICLIEWTHFLHFDVFNLNVLFWC